MIQSGHTSSNIYVFLDGKWQAALTKRIPLGGSHHNELLSKSLSLKYPQHRLTPDQIQEIQVYHTYCAKNYQNQLAYLEALYDKELE